MEHNTFYKKKDMSTGRTTCYVPDGDPQRISLSSKPIGNLFVLRTVLMKDCFYRSRRIFRAFCERDEIGVFYSNPSDGDDDEEEEKEEK